MRPSRDIERLLEIMAALRTPGTGCPWDLEQDFATIAPYTIEEAYEVADAITRGDLLDLKDELGDLLLQVVFHARMAEEISAFDFGDVVESITAKLLRRHPHVFGEARDLSPEAVKVLWGEIKQAEKAERRRERGDERSEAGLLDGIMAGLPALARADKLARKAAKVGFDWADPAQVVRKIEEEVGEIRGALDGGSRGEIEEEIGDLLFAVANLARHAGIDAESALRGANAKFERRFRAIEQALAASGRTAADASVDDMEELWAQAKTAERRSA
ncbi:MAG: nucleoside triphosphate pyrophosphohydrolase [Microvirga sp.]|jgi:ATP diphosphatase|nr:nucleoside triphosphate pyrophosphohydrolase [Microvirga sp.]